MNSGEILRYFKIVSRHFDEPSEVILTGAACGSFYGRIRASMDVDFAIRFKTTSAATKEKLWFEFKEATRKATIRTGMAAQYAEDIDRWSMISFLDYRKKARPFRHFGKIEIRLMDPVHWSIGKFMRYLSLDTRDLIQVLKRTKTAWEPEVRTLGRALRKSPRSTNSFLFRKHVEHFLTTYGRFVWGKKFNPGKALRQFHRAAGIPTDDITVF